MAVYNVIYRLLWSARKIECSKGDNQTHVRIGVSFAVKKRTTDQIFYVVTLEYGRPDEPLSQPHRAPRDSGELGCLREKAPPCKKKRYTMLCSEATYRVQRAASLLSTDRQSINLNSATPLSCHTPTLLYPYPVTRLPCDVLSLSLPYLNHSHSTACVRVFLCNC